MKELLLQYAAYHLWANGLIFDAIAKLDAETQNKEVPSSFPGLFKTCLHMWDAESIWWQRMKLQERIIRPSDNYKGDFNELSQQLLHQNKQWHDWINNAQEHMLQHVFMYQNSKGEQFKQPLFQMLLHIFNHGTYHRGQIVNIMRQLQLTKIPSTDFIVWSRKR